MFIQLTAVEDDRESPIMINKSTILMVRAYDVLDTSKKVKGNMTRIFLNRNSMGIMNEIYVKETFETVKDLLDDN